MENALHTKLLLAAEIWKLAEQEREKAQKIAAVLAARRGVGYNEATFGIGFAQEHPLAEFVPAVIKQLQEISEQL